MPIWLSVATIVTILIIAFFTEARVSVPLIVWVASCYLIAAHATRRRL